MFDENEYQAWRRATKNAGLWLHGSPGKGKSMLSMAVIENLRHEINENSKTALAFFLCDRDDYRRNNAQAILRGLLYYILDTHTHARRILRSEYDKQKDSLISSPNSLLSLWRVFKQVLGSIVSFQSP